MEKAEQVPPALLTSLGTATGILFLLLGVEITMMRKLLLVLKALEVVQQPQQRGTLLMFHPTVPTVPCPDSCPQVLPHPSLLLQELGFCRLRTENDQIPIWIPRRPNNLR